MGKTATLKGGRIKFHSNSTLDVEKEVCPYFLNNVSDIFFTISAPIPHNRGNHIGIKKNFFEYSQAPK